MGQSISQQIIKHSWILEIKAAHAKNGSGSSYSAHSEMRMEGSKKSKLTAQRSSIKGARPKEEGRLAAQRAASRAHKGEIGGTGAQPNEEGRLVAQRTVSRAHDLTRREDWRLKEWYRGCTA